MSEWSRNPPPLSDPPARRAARPLIAMAAALVVAALAGGLAGGFAVAWFDDDGGTAGAAPSTTNATSAQRQLVDEDSAISAAVSRVLPAIVTIVNDEQPSSADVDVVNVGTGIIVDARGFVVTNDHVVRQSAKLRVILSDGRELPASVVSSDAPFTDVAIVRILPQDVEPATFGDSDALQLGQRVIAIGNVLGDYKGTVTSGVVSGLHRTRRSDTLLIEDLVQTDAAINHGGSGGPLLNTRGEIVGLNTTVIRGTAGGPTIEGVGLSLSSNQVRPIVEAIVETGRFARPFVGITHQDIDAALARAAGLPVDHGAIVVRITDASPAAEAGLARGDIVLAMGEWTLSADLPFLNALAKLPPGETTTFRILRDGAERSLEVRVALRQ